MESSSGKKKSEKTRLETKPRRIQDAILENNTEKLRAAGAKGGRQAAENRAREEAEDIFWKQKKIEKNDAQAQRDLENTGKSELPIEPESEAA